MQWHPDGKQRTRKQDCPDAMQAPCLEYTHHDICTHEKGGASTQHSAAFVIVMKAVAFAESTLQKKGTTM